MKIGVFDSGVGGLSVARAIEQAMPAVDVVFMNDTTHGPYGTKSPDEIYGYVVPIFEALVAAGCEVIVVACNTVSTTLIDRLRAAFSTPLIALEPMVRPAAQVTQSGKIAVCATPTTLGSARYAQLKTMYASELMVIEPDCSDWSYLIEQNQMNEATIRSRIEPVVAQGADVIVLGCTHYHWIEDEIKAIAGPAVTVLQPETAIVAQLKRVLQLT